MKTRLPSLILLSSLSIAAHYGCSGGDEPPAGSGTGGDSSATGGDASGTGGDATASGGDANGTGGDETGTGGDETGTGGGGLGEPSGEFPSDTSAEGIAAFLASESYKSWRNDPEPRSGNIGSNPHGEEMRVFFNAEAVGSHGSAATVLSMSVKELYAEGVHVGTAVSLRPNDSEWIYYCDPTGDGELGNLCGVQSGSSYPIHGSNLDTQCAFCHGFGSDVQFFAPLPE